MGAQLNRSALLRDSLSDRLSATYFHVELLNKFQDHAAYVVQSTNPDISWHMFVDRHQRESQHLFDDLVFNLMSLFDYVSNFAGYIFYGDQIRARAKGCDPLNMRGDNSHGFKHLRDVLEPLRWSYVAEVADLSRRRNRLGNLKGNLFKGTRTGEQIARWDKALASSLRIYRNDVIHNWADPTSGGFSISIGNPANNTVTVNPPYRFHRDFGFSEGDRKETIIDAAFWLAYKATDAVRDLFEAVESDIEKNRQIARGSEHIKWEGEVYPDC